MWNPYVISSLSIHHILSFFEGHSICPKYNRAQASAVLSKVDCSTSQHNSILLTCENLYVNIVQDIEISVGSVFALCSFMLFLFDWVLYCSRDYLCWCFSSSTQSFQFSAKLHVLERNFICSTLLRRKELILHLSRNSQQSFNDLRNIKPEKGVTRVWNSHCHDTYTVFSNLSTLGMFSFGDTMFVWFIPR